MTALFFDAQMCVELLQKETFVYGTPVQIKWI